MRRLLLVLPLLLTLACGGSSGSSGTISDAGDDGAAPNKCQAGEKCCNGECQNVECRSDDTKCTCASTAILDLRYPPGTPPVASCGPIDGGICCSDSNGWCDCHSGAQSCGYEGSPATSCTPGDVMFCPVGQSTADDAGICQPKSP